MNVDLTGPALASHLADTLTDLEFELLIRNRISRLFTIQHMRSPELGEHHNTCSFHFKWDDKSIWCAALGANYNDTVSLRGEVLSMAIEDAAHQWRRQSVNKMSLLLPPPEAPPTDTAYNEHMGEEAAWGKD